MRDPARIPIVLETIRRIWEKYLDLRLMQLLLNCSAVGYYTEEEELTKELHKLYDDITALYKT